MKNISKTSALLLVSFTIFALSACSSPNRSRPVHQGFDAAKIRTIALLPITYDQAYTPPLPQDLKGTDLSDIIRRKIEDHLVEKGYMVHPIAFPATAEIDPLSGPLKIDPLILAENCPCETDGLMQIHVTFHYGINPIERSPDPDFPSQIYLNATARLIDKTNSIELWRGQGRARPFQSLDFHQRLRYAVRTLVQGLLKNFPSHSSDETKQGRFSSSI